MIDSGRATVTETARSVEVRVNGTVVRHEVPLRLLLVDFLRDILGLTGTHVGCSVEGRCGACTVLLNGESVKSCLMLAVQADGQDVVTIEGLGRPDALHPIQEAFWREHGLQCGFCTPGMIISAYQLLKRNPCPSEMEIRAGLSGNLCRCTGYVHIVHAVERASEALQAMTPEERQRWLAL